MDQTKRRVGFPQAALNSMRLPSHLKRLFQPSWPDDATLLFHLCPMLRPGVAPASSFNTLLEQARLAFPATGRPRETNVSLTHLTRKRVIHFAQKLKRRQDRPKHYIVLEGELRLYIYQTVKLIACMQSSKNGLYNSMLLKVEGFASESIMLSNEEGEEQFCLGHSVCREHLRSAHCWTLASCQGRTIGTTLGIYDTKHRNFSVRALYTALSRSRTFGAISIES